VIIAVDFDGTCVDHRFPDVGPELPQAANVLRQFVASGHQLILWTMRSGPFLDVAVEWFRFRGIPLFGVNCNPEQGSWTTSPKAFAHVYIDDMALGAPVIQLANMERPGIDWQAVENIFAGRAP
jgi:hypothetical protein